MIPISVCIITRNEEKNIGRCLQCIKDFPFEIIVVDTGSTDKTIEIAAAYTNHIYHFDWIKDFSAARNFSISKASNDWILVLDCDEFVCESDLEEMYQLMEKNPSGVGRLKRTSDDRAHTITIDRVERLFNRTLYHYERPIHEQVSPIGDTEMYLYPIPLSVLHEGYIGTKEEMDQKARRNLEILLTSEKDYPDAYTYFQIGQSYYMLSDWENACFYFEKGLAFDLSPMSEYVQLMIVSYGYSLIHMDRLDDAIQFFEQLYSYFDFLADYVFLMGYIYMKAGNYMKAALQFIKATSLDVFSVEGTNSYLAYFHLGVVYEMIGNPEMAKTFYEKCGSYSPATKHLQEILETK